MALSTTTRAKLVHLHGTQHLLQVTNPDTQSPSAIDYDALETAVEVAEAWFARRGYALTRADVELLAWADLWARPENIWGKDEKAKAERLERMYPQVLGSVVGSTAIASGDEGDRRAFTSAKLKRLDRMHSRGTRPQPGGDL